MHKQRIGILIAASIGAISTFLPWAHAPLIGSIPGSSGDGWFTFILFGIAIGLLFLGKKDTLLNPGVLIGIVVSGLLASAIGIWKIIDFNSKMATVDTSNVFSKAVSQSVGLGIGLYLVVIAGIAVLVAGLVLRKSDISATLSPETK